MSEIRILPESISNKIAAGEVVDRPASVTKELIENSIDAESTKIIVELEKGGISFIRVSDNGTGMSTENALLSLERHATSKIRNNNDLFAIKTLGFRGEAIPSIASVSKFSIITREKHSNIGTKVEVIGGKIKQVCDYGAALGVMIIVKDLFFNTPARKKFLKSVNTEINHIIDIMASMALVNPHISFRLIHNGKTVKSWPKSKNRASRISNILGNSIEKHLLEINSKENDISIKGWIANPKINRTTARGIYFFINNRYVKDKIIHHSLISAYSGKLMKGRYPIAIIFINLPYNQVDVNVHPTKCEVRFLNRKMIHHFLHRTINESLKQLDYFKWSHLGYSIPLDKDECQDHDKSKKIFKKVILNSRDKLNQKKSQYKEITNSNKLFTLKSASAYIEEPNTKDYFQASFWQKKFFSDLTIIGQYHNSYILCESKEALIIIDQHAAHERIVFEKLKLEAKRSQNSYQKLLIPELIEINFTESKILKKILPDLRNYGLKIEPFGGTTFVVKSIPTLLDNRMISTLVLELIEKTAEIGINVNIETIIYECLVIMACHNSTRAKQELNFQEMKKILYQLDDCENSLCCPHGRPIWIKMGSSYFKKNFCR